MAPLLTMEVSPVPPEISPMILPALERKPFSPLKKATAVSALIVPSLILEVAEHGVIAFGTNAKGSTDDFSIVGKGEVLELRGDRPSAFDTAVVVQGRGHIGLNAAEGAFDDTIVGDHRISTTDVDADIDARAVDERIRTDHKLVVIADDVDRRAQIACGDHIAENPDRIAGKLIADIDAILGGCGDGGALAERPRIVVGVDFPSCVQICFLGGHNIFLLVRSTRLHYRRETIVTVDTNHSVFPEEHIVAVVPGIGCVALQRRPF
jgi:hypothetical protein